MRSAVLVTTLILSISIIYTSSQPAPNGTSKATNGPKVTGSAPNGKPSKAALICSIFGILALLILSGLISGISLALLCLDIMDLKCVAVSGSEKERKYASRILPIRKHSNFIICSFIIAEVAVDAATTLLIESITNSWIAILVSTVLITIFGGILPQVFCHRYSLVIGAKTYILSYIIMILTFPLAYPISLLLDCMIGDDLGQVHNRKYLMSYIDLTKKENSLGKYQVLGITGALALNSKRVKEVMTPLKDVFMFSTTSIVDKETLLKALISGYSRIPIYQKVHENIVGLIHVKELTSVLLYDLNHPISVKFIVSNVPRPLIFINSETILTNDVLLNRFKDGLHLAFVVNKGDQPSPDAKIIGIMTLEDLIEEILQTEINDESDILLDNKTKRKRTDITYAHKLVRELIKTSKQPNKQSD